MNSKLPAMMDELYESEDICLVRIQGIADQAGGASRAVRVFGAAGINLEFITESSDASGFANITAAVGQRDEDRVEELLPLIRRETRSIKVDHQPGCLMLGVSGQALRGVPGVAGRLFSAFGESQVNLLAIASSMSSLCCVVRQQDRAKAVQVFSDVFGGFPAISNGR